MYDDNINKRNSGPFPAVCCSHNQHPSNYIFEYLNLQGFSFVPYIFALPISEAAGATGEFSGRPFVGPCPVPDFSTSLARAGQKVGEDAGLGMFCFRPVPCHCYRHYYFSPIDERFEIFYLVRRTEDLWFSAGFRFLIIFYSVSAVYRPSISFRPVVQSFHTKKSFRFYATMSSPTTKLNSGYEMPLVGFGFLPSHTLSGQLTLTLNPPSGNSPTKPAPTKSTTPSRPATASLTGPATMAMKLNQARVSLAPSKMVL